MTAAKPKGLDFSKGVRGKYYEDAKASLRVVILDADLQDTFPDSDSVNAALRSLRDLAKRTATAPRRTKRAA